MQCYSAILQYTGTRILTLFLHCLCSAVARILTLFRFLPGSLNVVVNRESRAFPAEGDWRLGADIFASIAEAWPIEIDMFAAA